MISSQGSKWIEVGKVLAKDPKIKVICPQCEKDYLIVEDVKNESNPNELERIMRCMYCGAYNILKLKRPN